MSFCISLAVTQTYRGTDHGAISHALAREIIDNSVTICVVLKTASVTGGATAWSIFWIAIDGRARADIGRGSPANAYEALFTVPHASIAPTVNGRRRRGVERFHGPALLKATTRPRLDESKQLPCRDEQIVRVNGPGTASLLLRRVRHGPAEAGGAAARGHESDYSISREARTLKPCW